MERSTSVDVATDPLAPAHVGPPVVKQRPTALSARTRALLQRSAHERYRQQIWFARGIAQHIDSATPWRSGEIPLSMRTNHKSDTHAILVFAAILLGVISWALQ